MYLALYVYAHPREMPTPCSPAIQSIASQHVRPAVSISSSDGTRPSCSTVAADGFASGSGGGGNGSGPAAASSVAVDSGSVADQELGGASHWWNPPRPSSTPCQQSPPMRSRSAGLAFSDTQTAGYSTPPSSRQPGYWHSASLEHDWAATCHCCRDTTSAASASASR
jgi:hypothetical protein